MNFLNCTFLQKVFLITCFLFLFDFGLSESHSQELAKYYVALSGSDQNAGTKSAPFLTIQKALDSATAGDLIYIRSGRHYVRPNADYNNWGLVIDHKNGSQSAPYRVEAYPGESVIIDGSKVPDGGAVLTIMDSSYWKFKGLIFDKSTAPSTWAMMGVVLYGESNYNVFDQIEVRYMDGPGLQIADKSSHNKVLNSKAHHNYDGDTKGGNADGFQVVGSSSTSKVPTGNVFENCESWNNGDDGFDLWQSYRNEIHNSRSWHNGYHPDGTTHAGDGSGFKLGRGLGGHTVTYSVAWDNRNVGFDYNGGAGDYKIYNNTAYKNAYSYAFLNISSVKVHNNIAYKATIRDFPNNDSALGTHNTWNLGISDPQFLSVDPKSESFLRLKSTSPARGAGIDVGFSGANTKPDLGAYPVDALAPGVPKNLRKAEP